MTLKIERFRARVRLSGELRSEHLDQVKTELHVEGVRFLNACEATGISVVDCSPYIREWMSREGRRETTGDKRKKRQISSEDEHREHE